jgi:CRISPR-associated protein Csm1
MLIIGDLSGIQEYLFDIAHEGGGQARRLRARSFFIQLLAECAALRVMRALNWTQNQIIFCGAGKFILDGPAITTEERAALAAEQSGISRWLLKNTAAQLRFSLALEEGVKETNEPSRPRDQFNSVMKSLQRAKLTAWSNIAAQNGEWQSSVLVLDPLDSPCALCRRRTAEVNEELERTSRRVCARCYDDREIGKLLPDTRWVAISVENSPGSSQVLDFGFSLRKEAPKSADFLIFTDAPPAPTVQGFRSDQIILRQLNRHIPVDDHHHPTDFGDIASSARGDKLLGVLKADVDSLGVIIDQTLKTAANLAPLAELSKELDGFFAGALVKELNKPEWRIIYTIFAGGDDLMLVGPWDVIVDFAAHVRELFRRKFGSRQMTLSAAVAFVKPRRPIKFAAEQAEYLLQRAKTEIAAGAEVSKDQIAAFGQLWKWDDHEKIIGAGKQLAKWVDERVAERGWLHTLLDIGLSRHRGELLGTSRLAYHVARNYPKKNDRNLERSKLRAFGDQLIANLDESQTIETIYLPAIARYALTATRRSGEEK